ncbi:alpha/beta hydrolase [Gordonia malaquae]|uniref:alpha/beta fold hydrolase n=1 Tax=Gordonia malaquae TaxID=410332 RepID=UPI0030FEC85B
MSIVFVHGWTLGAELFDRVIDGLLEKADGSVNIVSYDVRGHGRSDAGDPGRANLEQLADDLRSVIDACAPHGELIIVGHSMGGMTLLAFAERHRELLEARVTGAVFVCTSPGKMWLPFKRMPGFGAIAPRVLGMGSPSMIRDTRLTRFAVKHSVFGGAARVEDLSETIRQMQSVDKRAFAEYGLSMMQHERDELLPRFDWIRTVVFAGTRDHLTPLRHGRRIAMGIDGAMLVVESGAGHMVPLERPDSLIRELSAMVEESAASDSAARRA